MSKILAIPFLFFTLQTFGQDQPHKDSLTLIVKRYYELNINVFQRTSTISDIDAIFELFTDDFIYDHPKYGGTYSREDLYDGYVRNQKNGDYNGNVVDVKILNMIVGLNAVAVEKTFMLKSSEEVKPKMTVFEFRDGKIFKISEYW